MTPAMRTRTPSCHAVSKRPVCCASQISSCPRVSEWARSATPNSAHPRATKLRPFPLAAEGVRRPQVRLKHLAPLEVSCVRDASRAYIPPKPVKEPGGKLNSTAGMLSALEAPKSRYTNFDLERRRRRAVSRVGRVAGAAPARHIDARQNRPAPNPTLA